MRDWWLALGCQQGNFPMTGHWTYEQSSIIWIWLLSLSGCPCSFPNPITNNVSSCPVLTYEGWWLWAELHVGKGPSMFRPWDGFFSAYSWALVFFFFLFFIGPPKWAWARADFDRPEVHVSWKGKKRRGFCYKIKAWEEVKKWK